MLPLQLQSRRSRIALSAACLLLSSTVVTNAAAVPESAKNDPILRAMQSELDREQAQLLLPGMQRPYFIEYRLDDFNTYDAVANYGALIREDSAHQRIIRVTVRIGGYDLDSSSSRADERAPAASTTARPSMLRSTSPSR